MWQRSQSSGLSSHIIALKRKLLEVNGEVAKALKACKENAWGIEKLNETMKSFMKKLLGQLEKGSIIVILPNVAPIQEKMGGSIANGNLGLIDGLLVGQWHP